MREIQELQSELAFSKAEVRALQSTQADALLKLDAARGTSESLSAALMRNAAIASYNDSLKLRNASLHLKSAKVEVLETNLRHIQNILRSTESDYHAALKETCNQTTEDSRPLLRNSELYADARTTSGHLLNKVK